MKKFEVNKEYTAICGNHRVYFQVINRTEKTAFIKDCVNGLTQKRRIKTVLEGNEQVEKIKAKYMNSFVVSSVNEVDYKEEQKYLFKLGDKMTEYRNKRAKARNIVEKKAAEDSLKFWESEYIDYFLNGVNPDSQEE